MLMLMLVLMLVLAATARPARGWPSMIHLPLSPTHEFTNHARLAILALLSFVRVGYAIGDARCSGSIAELDAPGGGAQGGRNLAGSLRQLCTGWYGR